MDNLDDDKKLLMYALRRLHQIERDRELLKGHFSKVAKEYHISARQLKKAYESDKSL